MIRTIQETPPRATLTIDENDPPSTSVDHLTKLPEDLQIKIFETLQSTTPSQVSKEINENNCIQIDWSWSKLENLSNTHPILASYLNEVPTDISSDQKFRFLYTLMMDDVDSHNENECIVEDKIKKGNLTSEKLNPEEYLKLAQEIEDKSLINLWEYLRWQVQDREAPEATVNSAEVIRSYLNDPANTEQLKTIKKLYIEDEYILTLPRAIQNLTELQTICIESCNLRVLPEGIFQKSPKLQYVYFPNNKIRNLPKILFQNTDLKESNFSGNPVKKSFSERDSGSDQD